MYITHYLDWREGFSTKESGKWGRRWLQEMNHNKAQKHSPCLNYKNSTTKLTHSKGKYDTFSWIVFQWKILSLSAAFFLLLLGIAQFVRVIHLTELAGGKVANEYLLGYFLEGIHYVDILLGWGLKRHANLVLLGEFLHLLLRHLPPRYHQNYDS